MCAQLVVEQCCVCITVTVVLLLLPFLWLHLNAAVVTTAAHTNDYVPRYQHPHPQPVYGSMSKPWQLQQDCAGQDRHGLQGEKAMQSVHMCDGETTGGRGKWEGATAITCSLRRQARGSAVNKHGQF